MSRYTIPGLTPMQEVVVGWDPPLQTYFCTVCDYSVPNDQDHVLFWVGCTPGALTTVAALQTLIAAYVILPDAVWQALEADQQQPWSPSPLQTWVLDTLARTA